MTQKTRIIFLGNPDNPAGTYLTEKDVRSFLKGLCKDVLVFIDEAYFEYVTAKDYVDSIGLLKAHKNVIVTRTFSKMYGLAGLRIGYGIANPELIDLLNRIREPFNVNSLAQVGALACLKDKVYYRGLAKKVEGQRQFFYESLGNLGLEYVKTYTNFILLNVKKDSTQVSKQLLKKGIIIRDMSVWGLNTFIRISIGTAEENKILMRELEDILK
ncbi:Biosynthetic Aromatic amino acid aminotransferase beta @ Histidinol-phosphate aminotransferase [hydrothermal vent metagenome]|uniref:Biosynthetic Aromatic amino acid aminotransferase beta @ Histidinol-phosphate aminotransferase n=1 Tax=hydrothermal vent metagenome TaxID=652676 RepID=A0A3B1DJI1_9ZZZZ